MGEYVCSVCEYIYDEAKGIPEAGIAPGTSWGDLPDNWTCPQCGATKAEFTKQGEPTASDEKNPISQIEASSDFKEMSPSEIRALCKNLARGCEKQYKPEEAALFNELADYFKVAATPAKNPDFDQLLVLIEKDLEDYLPNAKAVAAWKTPACMSVPSVVLFTWETTCQMFVLYARCLIGNLKRSRGGKANV